MNEKIHRSPRLNIIPHYKRLMKRYYFFAKHASWLGKKVGWITSGAPVELLYAMGVIPVYPENHGAICGASNDAVELCQIAEGSGFSPDLCSYMRCDIGSSIAAKSPIGGLPKPDFLLCCNNICGTVLKWFQIQSRFYNVPLFFLDTPFIHAEVKNHSIHFVKQQLEELIEFLEKNTRKKFDEKNLKKSLKFAREGITLWRDILALNKSQPAPLSCFDAFINMAPIVTMRGTKRIIDFYRKLKQELTARQQKGIGAITREKFRLLWDNIPIWHQIRNLYDTFTMYGANLVADTYTTAWTLDELKGAQPVESVAKTYLNVFLNQGITYKINNMIKLMDEFSIDGFIMHSNRSCKPYSFGQYDIKRIVSQKTGKPGLIIEADMTDSRLYFDAQTKTKIAAFMEML